MTTSTATDAYRPRTVRRRATKAEIETLDAALISLVALAGPPVTVRQVFYMAAGRGLVPKSDQGYRQIIRRIACLRDSSLIDWQDIADNTRWVRRARTYDDLATALDEWQAHYRRDYWAAQPYRVELWVESDSIASFLDDTVEQYGVPMYVCRGQASRTYIRGAANDAQASGKPVRILYVGDFDPSGLAIDRSLIERYAAFSQCDVELELTRVAVTPDQVTDFNLFGNPAKRSDPNFNRFANYCERNDLPPLAYETEALPPQALRSIVEEAIAIQVDLDKWRAVAEYETAERAQLHALLGDLQ